MDCVIRLRFFILSLFCSKYVSDIHFSILNFKNGLCKFNNHLFTRLRKRFSSREPKEKQPTAGLYNYNVRQIELF